MSVERITFLDNMEQTILIFTAFLSVGLHVFISPSLLCIMSLSDRNHGSGQHAAQPILSLLPHVGTRGSTRPTQEEAHQHRDQRASDFRAQL